MLPKIKKQKQQYQLIIQRTSSENINKLAGESAGVVFGEDSGGRAKYCCFCNNVMSNFQRQNNSRETLHYGVPGQPRLPAAPQAPRLQQHLPVCMLLPGPRLGPAKVSV